jgi:hypothetical protein
MIIDATGSISNMKYKARVQDSELTFRSAISLSLSFGRDTQYGINFG